MTGGDRPTTGKRRVPVVLLVSGMDPTGGAGMSADIRTAAAVGVYPVSAVTALTVQNHTGVKSVNPVTADLLRDELEAIYESCRPDAVKIGLIPDPKLVTTLADVLKKHRQNNVVVDPVLSATAGGMNIGDEQARVIASQLLPLATLVTPNERELRRLKVYISQDMSRTPLLITGGDADNDSCTDLLRMPGHDDICFTHPKIAGINTHGTGCVLSTAIASYLAIGLELPAAARHAKDVISRALATSARLEVMPDYGPAMILDPYKNRTTE